MSRQHVISTRISGDDLDALDQAAEHEGMTRGEFARAALLAAIARSHQEMASGRGPRRLRPTRPIATHLDATA